jgi:hypothetical protein
LRCGSLAQLVEQRPEEPCVPSSSLGGATKIIQQIRKPETFVLGFLVCENYLCYFSSSLAGHDDLHDQPMLQFVRMKHLYLFTLEIDPLEVGKVYDELPSHLTLMSRFVSDRDPKELNDIIRPVIESAGSVTLTFNSTIELGPKKVIAHMVDSPDEKLLHKQLQGVLEEADVIFKYPQFIGSNHKAHVTQRDGKDFPQGNQLVSSAVYLIEVIDKKRIVRTKIDIYIQ